MKRGRYTFQLMKANILRLLPSTTYMSINTKTLIHPDQREQARTWTIYMFFVIYSPPFRFSVLCIILLYVTYLISNIKPEWKYTHIYLHMYIIIQVPYKISMLINLLSLHAELPGEYTWLHRYIICIHIRL